jgi:hypothetical protein
MHWQAVSLEIRTLAKGTLMPTGRPICQSDGLKQGSKDLPSLQQAHVANIVLFSLQFKEKYNWSEMFILLTTTCSSRHGH